MKPVPGPTSAPLHPLQVLAHSEPVQRDGQPGRLGRPAAHRVHGNEEPEREPGLARLTRLLVGHVVPANVDVLAQRQEQRPDGLQLLGLLGQCHAGQSGGQSVRAPEQREALAAGGAGVAAADAEECGTARPAHAHQQQPNVCPEGESQDEECLLQFE